LSGDIADYQTRILPDGSTVVRLYYTRNSYDVSYVFANEPAEHTDLPATVSHRYGESVNVAANASAS
jgi:hypothetical protein